MKWAIGILIGMTTAATAFYVWCLRFKSAKAVKDDGWLKDWAKEEREMNQKGRH